MRCVILLGTKDVAGLDVTSVTVLAALAPSCVFDRPYLYCDCVALKASRKCSLIYLTKKASRSPLYVCGLFTKSSSNSNPAGVSCSGSLDWTKKFGMAFRCSWLSAGVVIRPVPALLPFG